MTDRTLRSAAAIVALAGVALAGHLTVAHYSDGSALCVVGSGCEEVQESDYASVLGVPVALLGLISYAAALALVVWDVPAARLAAAALGFAALLFSAYLLVVQLFVIDAVCAWCLANDVVVAPALALVTGLRLIRS